MLRASPFLSASLALIAPRTASGQQAGGCEFENIPLGANPERGSRIAFPGGVVPDGGEITVTTNDAAIGHFFDKRRAARLSVTDAELGERRVAETVRINDAVVGVLATTGAIRKLTVARHRRFMRSGVGPNLFSVNHRADLTSVAPGELNTTKLGVNWYRKDHVRVMANLVDGALSGPGAVDTDVSGAQLRLQWDF